MIPEQSYYCAARMEQGGLQTLAVLAPHTQGGNADLGTGTDTVHASPPVDLH